MNPANTRPVHVLAGIILNNKNEVFLAKRAKHQHQGDLWEFPGGKKEAGEKELQALRRELAEELGIDVLTASPFKKISHLYSDKAVLLDFWLVDSFNGEPQGLEGQLVRWVPVNDLRDYHFPAANQPIVDMLLSAEHELSG